MKQNIKPPVLSKWLLQRMAFYEDNHSILGDFEETFLRILKERGTFRTRWWYRLQVLRSLPKYFWFISSMVAIMLKNYLLITVRNIKKSKIFSLINISGLAIGIASCLLILIHIRYELSYDDFHENAGQIYRVVLEHRSPERVRNWGWNSPKLSKTLAQDYPEVDKGVRILTETGPTQLKHNNKGEIEKGVIYTDPEFFEIFSIPVIQGDDKNFLKDPESMIITQKMAEKYFGSDDPMGKIITVRNWWEEEKPHIVTGVIKDLPANSHFHYRCLIPLSSTEVNDFEWGSWYAFNYILLHEGADFRELENKLPAFINKYFPNMFEDKENAFRARLAAGHSYRYFLQPLQDIHLKSRIEHEFESVGNIIYVYMFALIAGFILLLACINFINLSTSRSINRAREVGVRKVLGSFRKQLIGQFLFESILMCLLSMVLAIGIVAMLFPAFISITGADIWEGFFNYSIIIPSLLIFTVILGIFSGIYPAFYLSSFQPVSVLKGIIGKRTFKTQLRNILVVFQFTVSIALITGTLFVKKQVDFMLSKDLGFNKDNIIVIENAVALGKAIESFKTEIKKDPDVVVAAGGAYPGVATHTFTTRALGISKAPSVSIYNIGGDQDYIETLGIEVKAGRKYPKETSPDFRYIMFNESAVQALGFTDPIGKQVATWDDQGATIIGVIKDFHFRSLHNDIAPFAFFHIDNNEHISPYICVRIRPQSFSSALPKIESKWKEFTGGLAFQYTLLDETLNRWYISEKNTGLVTAVFSGLAIFIGCLGLFGLAAFTVEQRSREAGIRKILGASITSILMLFMKDFIKLVGLAFFIAIPITYLIINRWLHGFAYSINPEVGTFLIAGVLTIVISTITVSYQVLKVTFTNPTDTLRHE